MAELRRTGSVQPFEKEYFRKDGSRVPVLVGAAAFEESATQGVSFVLDLTERKRAEAEARESERRYREVQMELAHANRVATMGQLTASIAHEVKQPIAATATNAEAALRWLGARPPNLEEARQALDRIVNDAMRAGDIIGRIRDLIKKGAPTQGRRGHQRGDPRGDRADPRRSGQERRLGADAPRGRLAAYSRRSGPTATSDPELDHQRH